MGLDYKNENWYSVKEIAEALDKSVQSIYGRIKRRENELEQLEIKLDGVTYYAASTWQNIILADIAILPEEQKTEIDLLREDIKKLKVALKNINKKIDKIYKILSTQQNTTNV